MESIGTWGKVLVYTSFGLMMYPGMKMALMPEYQNMTERRDKTAIVTGSTGKLGVALTHHMSLRKMRVIMAARDMEKCKLLKREIALITGNRAIVCRHLDLEDIDSINRFADDMIQNEPHIDILVNNAAVKKVDKKELVYGVEKNYFVNFLAPYLLTFRLLDKLKSSSLKGGDSRIINVIGNPRKSWTIRPEDINFDERKYNPKEAYRQSKLALAYFTIYLDKMLKEAKDGNVYVFGTSPVYSNMTRPYFRPKGFLEAVSYFWDIIFKTDCDSCIMPTLKCAIDKGLADREKSGQLYSILLRSYGWRSIDASDVCGKMVWNMALETLLKLNTSKSNKSIDVKSTDPGDPSNTANNSNSHIVKDNSSQS